MCEEPWQWKTQLTAGGASACRYACLEGPQAMHMKGTLVRQGAGSSYKLTEARLGGRLTRQDIHIVQVWPFDVVICCHSITSQ